jgi:hypothetical protein
MERAAGREAGRVQTDRDEAFEAQLSELRGRLVRDGASSGIDEPAVLAAVDAGVERYSDASVRGFLGVLIERHVRRKLAIDTRST